MNNIPTPETVLECAFALLKCSPIGNPENSSAYGRVAYILSEHCQGKEDVSEASMRIFAERIAELERELAEARELAREFRDALVSIEEYWNRDQNEAAMADACWHAVNVAQDALAKAKEVLHE